MMSKKNTVKVFFLFVLAVFIGTALVSYDQRDWGSFWRANNMCGPLGAIIAGVLRYACGPLFAWAIPLFILFWGVQAARRIPLGRAARKLFCLTLLCWIVMALVAAAGGDGAGGYIGVKSYSFLEIVFGRIGSILVLSGALAVTVVLLMFRSIRSFVDRLGRFSLPRLRLPAWKRPAPDLRRRSKPPVERRRREADRVIEETGGRSSVRIAVPKPQVPIQKRREQPAAKQPVRPSAGITGAENAPLPELSLLGDYDATSVSFSKDDLIARSEIIESKLADYGLAGKVQEVRPGPVVTTFEFVPASGVKVSQIASRSDDIALALAARAIRILAPIPGKGAVGIEVPNPEPQIVTLRELMEHYPSGKGELAVVLGKTVTGEPFFTDIADMPHLLIAGATGSGKSVCINAIICSLLFHHTPATCRFIMVDPKRLELVTYHDIPHLLHPVITEAKQTLKVLQWLTVEMERRYRMLASAGVKNIANFNRKVVRETVTAQESDEPYRVLPYYILVIDELADIMVMVGNEIYPPITRLSQMARAVGIHLVFATQRPSVDVVTGLIKANFPCRLAFQVTSKTDSRTILDINGAETLLGSGDMLYLPKNLPTPVRIQGAYISESEAEKVAGYWRAFTGAGDELDLTEGAGAETGGDAQIDDEFYNQAKELVIIHQQGSISLLQRRLRVGYARAARLIDMLEQSGVVGPFEGSKARRVLISREEYERS